MVRRFARFAFGLALMVTLGFAMAHAHPLKVPGGPIGFSTPCEPASPAVYAASEARVVSTVASTFAVENAGAVVRASQGFRSAAESRAVPLQGVELYSPLFKRPPPFNF